MFSYLIALNFEIGVYIAYRGVIWVVLRSMTLVSMSVDLSVSND
jgi:hypothetical protein